MEWNKISEYPLPKKHDYVLCLALQGDWIGEAYCYCAWQDQIQDYVYVNHELDPAKYKPLDKEVFKYVTKWRWIE